MFDIWRPADAIDGRYAWLPVQFNDDGFNVEWSDAWDLSFFDKQDIQTIFTDSNKK